MHNVGIDIIEIERIQKSITTLGQRFLDRIFTPNEQDYCKSRVECYAARFAAKEAVIKVLETPIAMNKIEVVKKESGAVKIHILDPKYEQYSELISLSISHSKIQATAIAMLITSD